MTEVAAVFLWVFALVAVLFLVRPFTVVLHELGHGIAALLLSSEKTTLYIGSYGDPAKSHHLNFGRLEIFFKYDILMWDVGMCLPHHFVSFNKFILIVLAGPMVSLLFGISLVYSTIAFEIPGVLKLIFFVCASSAIIDFFNNIIPKSKSIELFDGTLTNNDGQTLLNLLRHKSFSKEYSEAFSLLANKDYKAAAEKFKAMLDGGMQIDYVHRVAIWTSLQLKDYPMAKELDKQFREKYELGANDYVTSGLIKSRMKAYEEGLCDYNKSLEITPSNVYALNNRGYTCNVLGRYNDAIVDFDKVLELDPTFAHSLNNRGFSKIKLGKLEEGYSDIIASLRLDNQNAYAFRNFGIYHFEKSEFQSALENFEKAAQLDSDIDLLPEYLHATKEKIKS